VNISNSEFDTHYVIVFSTKAVYKILPKGTLTYRAYTLVEYFFSLLTYTSTEYRQRERERERFTGDEMEYLLVQAHLLHTLQK